MTADTNSLNENDVVDIVCRFLEAAGYVITTRLLTTQTGDDIVAVKSGSPERWLHVEAKGATSARVGSARYGKPFDSAQVRVHVAETVFKAAQVLSRPVVEGRETRAGIAVPANSVHESQLATLERVLAQLEIAVLWVSGDGTVEFRSGWAL